MSSNCCDAAIVPEFLQKYFYFSLQNAPFGNIYVIYYTFSYILPVRETFLYVYFLRFFIHIGINMYRALVLMGISFIEISCTSCPMFACVFLLKS